MSDHAGKLYMHKPYYVLENGTQIDHLIRVEDQCQLTRKKKDFLR